MSGTILFFLRNWELPLHSLFYILHKYNWTRNVSNTHSNTHLSTHFLWLVNTHMGPTKCIWDPHDLVGPMWILTNQRKCVLKCVLLAFLFNNCLKVTFVSISFLIEFIYIYIYINEHQLIIIYVVVQLFMNQNIASWATWVNRQQYG